MTSFPRGDEPIPTPSETQLETATPEMKEIAEVSRTRKGHCLMLPTGEQVEWFFPSSIFMGCKSWKKPHETGDEISHRGAYFGPLLAYYQGMRRQDYCSLAVTEVVSNNGSHPYLKFKPSEFRRLRNPYSPPNLPLHPELMRLGFIE